MLGYQSKLAAMKKAKTAADTIEEKAFLFLSGVEKIPRTKKAKAKIPPV